MMHSHSDTTETFYRNRSTKDLQDSQFRVDLPLPHINQEKVLKSKARYRVVASGRRFGKSALSIISCVLRLFRGEKMWHCSPTNQNAKRIFREFIKILRSFPESHVIVNKTDMRIDFLFNDAFIEFKSLAEPENLRGEGLDFIVIDEAAFCQDNIWEEILEPMLLGRSYITGRDGEALFISSTNGRNWFWRMFQLGLNEDEPEYESFQFTSYDNPLIPAKEIDSIKRKTPSYVFEREYMAIFEDSGGQVFKKLGGVLRRYDSGEDIVVTILGIDYKCESEEDFVNYMLTKQQSGDCNIVFGIDFAQKDDFTFITVFDMETGSLIEYVRINKMLWEDIRDAVKDLNEKWQPIFILAEENGQTVNIELLQKEGLPIEGLYTSTKTKPELINKLAVAIEQKELSLPNDRLLIGELSSFEMVQTKAGNMKYGAPKGLHDDGVISLALCNWCRDSVLPEDAFKIITIDM